MSLCAYLLSKNACSLSCARIFLFPYQEQKSENHFCSYETCGILSVCPAEECILCSDRLLEYSSSIQNWTPHQLRDQFQCLPKVRPQPEYRGTTCTDDRDGGSKA